VQPDRRRLPARLAALTVLLPLAWFLYVGDRGIAFGHHWDEPLLLTDVKTSLRTRTLLPTGTANYDRPGLAGGNYEYPSALYWVGMAMTAPHVLRDGLDPAVPIDPAFVDTELFTIRLRQACLALSSLAIVGTFALGWAVTRRWPAGLLAASLLATSWEVNYHGRWIAPDGLLMAVASACLLLCVASLRRPRAIGWAAVAAGLATGTKYPGGLLVVPVLTAAVLARPAWRTVGRLPLLLLAMAVTFIVTTPGVVLQPWNFAAWVQFNRDHYGTIGHFGHTILNHRAHALAMLEYLSLALPSRWTIAALPVSLLAIVGAVALCRRDRRAAAVLLPFPVLYVGYFSQQIVMIVRNLLVLAPVLAVLAAVGATTAWDAARRIGAPDARPLPSTPATDDRPEGDREVAKARRQTRRRGDVRRPAGVPPAESCATPVAHPRFFFFIVCFASVFAPSRLRGRLSSPRRLPTELASVSMDAHPWLRRAGMALVASILAVVVAADAAWEWSAGGHMADRRSPAYQAAAAAEYLARHPSLRVFPSDGAAAALHLPTVPTAGTRDVVLAFAQEDGDMWRWPANVPGLTLATFGPFACNFDYYPNWMDNRLVLMDVAQARRVPVAQVERAVRRHDVLQLAPCAGDLLAYLDCGGTPSVTDHGITLRALNGVAVGCQGDVAVPQPDALTIQADNHQVAFEITGLNPGSAYLVGWSWWDWNRGHRHDSVWAAWDGATVTDGAPPDPARTAQLLGPTVVPPWPLVSAPTPHDLSALWPPRPLWWRPIAAPRWAALPAAACRSGSCRIVFRREVGVDVVVSGLWVFRTRP
jgi:hypothetical protein